MRIDLDLKLLGDRRIRHILHTILGEEAEQMIRERIKEYQQYAHQKKTRLNFDGVDNMLKAAEQVVSHFTHL